MADIKKEKKKRKSNIVLIIIFFAIGFYGIFSCVKEIKTSFDLKGEIKADEQLLSDLKSQKEELEKDKTNLENPDYIVRYARGKYMVTNGDGEQVFKLPETDSDSNE